MHGIPRDTVRLAKAVGLGFATSVEGEPPDGPYDVVVECSGYAGGMRTCLEAARRGGTYVQVGLAGRDVSLPFDEVCYRELTVTSGNASTPTSWRRALQLIEERSVDLAALVTEVVPLAEWERAFTAVRAAEVVKVVLDPR